MRTFLFLAILVPGILSSQEGLRPLRSNPQYIYRDLARPVTALATPLMQKAVSLFLPFKEDFSYAHSSNYPSQEFWSDSSVYVSAGLGRAPLSLGVATFDGLNKNGYPYEPNLVNTGLSKPADTLTSRPINLQKTSSGVDILPTSSVGISFYYQPRGNGEPTEINDSIILDLYQPAQDNWVKRVWFKKGNSPADSIFRRAFIYIKDTAYLHDNFKFRFRNSATGSGDFDHWLIDYIHLATNRDTIEDNNDDLAFSHIPSPFLKDYSAMPWNQYRSFEMDTMISVRIRNNSKNPLPIPMEYAYYVYDSTGQQLHNYNGNVQQLKRFATDGYSKIKLHSNPAVKFSFPTLSDSMDFNIKHVLSRSTTSTVSPEFFKDNDTMVQYHRFRNYYAFDDGSAEAGYFVNGNKGKMALKIKLNEADELRALRIYFDPVGSISTSENYQFRIYVWNSANGPGGILYRDSVMKQKYLKQGFKTVPEYTLTTPLSLQPGTYYIGIEQMVDKSLTVGYDRNYDFHQSLYFNSGTGWQQSVIYGSLMMRPVFGDYIPPPVGIGENAPGSNFIIYPNPTTGEISVNCEQVKNASLEVYNHLGQLVKKQTLAEINSIVDLSQNGPGIYVVVVTESNTIVHRQKLVIAR